SMLRAEGLSRHAQATSPQATASPAAIIANMMLASSSSNAATSRTPAATAQIVAMNLPAMSGRLVRAVATQALVSTLQKLVGRQGLGRVQLVHQHGLEPGRHLLRVAVAAAGRLAHHLVDQAEAVQALGGQAQ